MNIKCPNCGTSWYTQHYSTTTAIGWEQTYKDGIPQNNNPNISTTYCTCCKCKHDFHYKEQYGEIIETIDDGEKPPIPTINVPLTFASDFEHYETKIPIEQLLAPSSSVENEIKFDFATHADIERLEKEIHELREEIYKLKGLLGYVESF